MAMMELKSGYGMQRRTRMTEREIQRMRYEIASAVVKGGSYRSIAAEYGVSHQTVMRCARRLLERIPSRIPGRCMGFRFRKDYSDYLATGKTGPKIILCPIRDAIREKIVRAKTEHPEMGARKLAFIAGVKASAPTVMKVLREEGLLPSKSRSNYRKMEKEFSNCMWQIDFTILGNELGTGKSVYFLSVLDDYSRMVMASDVTTEPSSDYVISSLEKCIAKYGKPYQILSDHGLQWYSGKGWSDFDIWCSKNGIEHVTGKFLNPRTSGKVERWHRTMKCEMNIPKAARLPEYRSVTEEYVVKYNEIRPHTAKCYNTPAKAFVDGLAILRSFLRDEILCEHMDWIVGNRNINPFT